QRFASFSRLLLLDRRGTGLSDHILDRDQQLPIEKGMEDIRAVMGAADSARATLLGLDSGFAVAAMFAATVPERTVGLIAYGATARVLWAPDYPIGVSLQESDADIADVERAWATDELARGWVEAAYPGAGDEALEVEDYVAWMRGIGGPADAAAAWRVEREIDLREVLPTIRVPTLVIHRREDRLLPIEHGRYLAAHIPGAELAELPGDIHMWDVGDDFPLEVERFVSTIHEDEVDLDRYLATVLFTDIVDSSAVASARGDREWAALVEQHHGIVRGQLARHRGIEMDTAGDGFFATFDGPARAVRCAQAVADAVREQLDIRVRAGVHTGEVQEIDAKAGGIAVTIGARIADAAGASEILVSSTVKDLTAGSGIVFEDAGEHELKGIADHWRLYRVAG
ncbi:MAG: alpha/beta fold hydrolase, partial [Actinomycetota bacterium]